MRATFVLPLIPNVFLTLSETSFLKGAKFRAVGQNFVHFLRAPEIQGIASIIIIVIIIIQLSPRNGYSFWLPPFLLRLRPETL